RRGGPDVGVVGPQPQGLAVARLGLRGAAEGGEGQTQGAVEDGLRAVVGERAADVLDGLLVAAGVVGGDAEEAAGVGVAAVLLEALAGGGLRDRRRQSLYGRPGAFLACRPVKSPPVS